MSQDKNIPLEKFSYRHIGISDKDQNYMLNKLGYKSISSFINDVIPQNIKRKSEMSLEDPVTEKNLLKKIKQYASLNSRKKSLIGMGFYGTHTPSVLLRNILENPAWYTAYTPYQPEISQGRLEALLNFQTMVSEITSLPIANASLLDESTAAAEAMSMAIRSTQNKNVVFLDQFLHPQTLNVIRTRAEPLGIKLKTFKKINKNELNDCA